MTGTGVRFLALVGPQVVGLLFSGVIVQLGISHVSCRDKPQIDDSRDANRRQVLIIIAGQLVMLTGLALLVFYALSSIPVRIVNWVVTLALTGLGTGLGAVQPYTALNVAFADINDVIIGNAILSFFGQLGGGIAVSIASLVFNQAITPTTLGEDRNAVLLAVRKALYVAFSVAIIGLFVAFCFEWKSSKQGERDTETMVPMTHRNTSRISLQLDESWKEVMLDDKRFRTASTLKTDNSEPESVKGLVLEEPVIAQTFSIQRYDVDGILRRDMG
jgi:hypothetical protein